MKKNYFLILFVFALHCTLLQVPAWSNEKNSEPVSPSADTFSLPELNFSNVGSDTSWGENATEELSEETSEAEESSMVP